MNEDLEFKDIDEDDEEEDEKQEDMMRLLKGGN